MITCTASSLQPQAACFSCLTEKLQSQIRTSLWCKIANTGFFGAGGGRVLSQQTFQLNASGSFIIAAAANLGGAPMGATSAELWTAPDGVNFTLNHTFVPADQATLVTPPTTGNFLFGKFRFLFNGVPAPFGAVSEISGRVANWAQRVVINGSQSSILTNAAVNTFDLALVAAGIDSKMVYVLPYAPDSLIAALTPLYKVRGNDPATNHNFVGADLTVNGLIGDGATKFLDSGVSPTAQWPVNIDGDAGLSAYKLTGFNGANVEIGTNDANGNCYLQASSAAGNGSFACYGATPGSDLAQGPNNAFAGFVSGQRTSAIRADLYTANSTTPFSSIGAATGNLNQTGTLVAQNIFIHALNLNGAASNFNAQRLSFAAINIGMNSASTQNFFNAVQALRVALGGGFV